MESLIKEIEKYIAVSEALKIDLSKYFQLKELAKNDKLVREGQFNVPLSFISSGILRCFNLKNDKDITNDFFFENTFVTDYEALSQNKAAKQNFEAIEPAMVYILPAANLFELTETYPELREWGAKMAESLFAKVLGNNSLLKSDSPEERYLGMLQEKPMIIQRLPLHYIASYLGITQVHLSRIRKKVQ
jgi:CRP-like cAMP-binding protein